MLTSFMIKRSRRARPTSIRSLLIRPRLKASNFSVKRLMTTCVCQKAFAKKLTLTLWSRWPRTIGCMLQIWVPLVAYTVCCLQWWVNAGKRSGWCWIGATVLIGGSRWSQRLEHPKCRWWLLDLWAGFKKLRGRRSEQLCLRAQTLISGESRHQKYWYLVMNLTLAMVSIRLFLWSSQVSGCPRFYMTKSGTHLSVRVLDVGCSMATPATSLTVAKRSITRWSVNLYFSNLAPLILTQYRSLCQHWCGKPTISARFCWQTWANQNNKLKISF